MNTRSSINRQDNVRNQGHLTGATKTASSRTASRSSKRWQPRPRRASSIDQQRQLASELSPADRDILLRQQALAEAQQRNYADAVEVFSQLIERNPSSATDYNNRGLVYFQSGQTDAAIADYNKALQINPRLDSAYNNRANYYATRGEFLEAILDYDTALDLNPSNVRAWINQGITFRDLQLYERAIESFEFALCLERLEGHIYAERGRTYHLWGDWNCAMADYQRAIAKFSHSGTSISNSASRLRFQVEGWLTDLLSLLE